MAEERFVGTVKHFDLERGFGFIRTRDRNDVYVNIQDVQKAGIRELHEGDRISFTIEKTQRGERARNLERIEQVQEAIAPVGSRRDTQTDFQFGPDYLHEGYFTKINDKDYLRAEELDKLSVEIAKLLVNKEMKTHQIRRIFNNARGIEAKLANMKEKDFEAIKPDIIRLKSNVARQVKRQQGKLVPEEFRQFIERNVELAIQNEKSFKLGFLTHFEMVVAYFVYYSPEKEV